MMKNNSAAKWVVLSTAVTAVLAFAAGVAYELRSIKKLTVDLDAEDDVEDASSDETEEVVEEVIEEVEAPAETETEEA